MASGCGRGVLVVEDEALIAMDLQDILEAAGYEVLGPANSIDTALVLIRHRNPELAVLDVNLARTNVFPLADVLSAKGTPFCFLTGHSKAVLPEPHAQCPLINKPFLPDTLLTILTGLAHLSEVGCGDGSEMPGVRSQIGTGIDN